MDEDYEGEPWWDGEDGFGWVEPPDPDYDTGYFTPTIDDDYGDDAEAVALAYFRGVCSNCRANVAAGYCVLCGLRDYCAECDYDLWFAML